MSPELAATFNFHVVLTRSSGTSGMTEKLGDGGFQECSGLDVSMDVLEFSEGGRNDGVVRRLGRAKYSPLVLRRGMLHSTGGSVDPVLWTWLQDAVGNRRPVPRYDGVVEVLDLAGIEVVARWAFDRGLPAKVAGPTLNAKTGEIAIEELTIAHEGLRLST